MTAIPTMTSRTRPTVINLRRSHRRLAFELTAGFASAEPGSPGNDLGGGDCPSILFKALRMELKMTILQNCIFLPIGMLEYWNYGLWNYRENDRHWKPNSLNTYKMIRSIFSAAGGPLFHHSKFPLFQSLNLLLCIYYFMC